MGTPLTNCIAKGKHARLIPRQTKVHTKAAVTDYNYLAIQL
jgi:hypothetical protein